MGNVRPLPPPVMHVSTKVAIAALSMFLATSLALPFIPHPARWILLLVYFMVGLPLLLVVLADLGDLRQQQMVARNIEVQERLARWRRWLPWILPLLVVALAWVWLGSWLLAAPFAALALVREFILSVNVVQWLEPEHWTSLRRRERVRLRISLLLMALAAAAISLGVLAMIFIVVFAQAQPPTLESFGFAGLYGLILWPMGKACAFGLTRALRRVPPDPKPATRAV